MNETTIVTTATETKPMNETTIVTTATETKPIMAGILEDNSGGASSMRLFMLAAGGFILLVHGFAYIWCVLHGLPLPDIPLQWSLAFSSLIVGKVGQKYFEK